MAVDGEQIVVLTKWGVRWLKYAWGVAIHGSRKEVATRAILSTLDGVEEDPECFIDAHTYTSTHVVRCKGQPDVVGSVVRTKKVLRKGRRSSFAASVAQLAYNKFGQRPMSEANILVTRRWIQKLLDEKKYEDLRTCDKNLTIDRALFLSFVPTDSFRAMKLAVTTSAWKDRCDDNAVYGKVFRLVSPTPPLGGVELVA